MRVTKAVVETMLAVSGIKRERRRGRCCQRLVEHEPRRVGRVGVGFQDGEKDQRRRTGWDDDGWRFPD